MSRLPPRDEHVRILSPMRNSDTKSEEVLDLIHEADRLTRRHHPTISIERALFLSWYCEKRDCKFCYMSTLDTSPRAKRTLDSVLAEVLLCKHLHWNIEFLSGGYGVYSPQEIQEIAEKIAEIYQKPWLNTGIMSKNEIALFGDEITGITGALETFDFDLHSVICPSKPFSKVLKMLDHAKNQGLKTTITIILGLGEQKEKIENLFSVIRDYKIDRVTFYALNPQKGTLYEKFPSPASLYYAEIVARTRIAFPHLEIITGIWLDKTPLIGPLLLAGSSGITKFPMKRLLKHYADVKEEIAYTATIQEREFNARFKIDEENLKREIKSYTRDIREKIDEYVNVV